MQFPTLIAAAAAAALLAGARPAAAGLPWPQPASLALGGASLAVDSRFFSFDVVGAGADSSLLQGALARYAALLFVRAAPASPVCNATLAGNLTRVAVNVTGADETLALNTSEAYKLSVSAADGVGAATLTADSVYGAMRGLETLSQLVDFAGGAAAPYAFVVPTVEVDDKPRFAHRGALVDTSRHYVPVPTLMAYLDAMAYNKLNVFHWHIVDDQAFPFVSTSFPGLSAMGSWNAPDPSHTYTPRDVQNVLAYAKGRGIRTVVEFDTPGHSTSWGLSQPGLLTQCYSNATGTPQLVPGSFGPIDPTTPATWAFLGALFAEIAQVFPDTYIHIGGDEVGYDCWASNPSVVAWMVANNIASFQALESYYVQRVINLIASLGKGVVAWQEVFDNNLTLPESTVVIAWKGGAAAGPAEMARITSGGFRALLSAGWYENYIAYGAQWPAYYALDPADFGGHSGDASLVLGGELACWGEFVDATNLISRVWPYGSAIAERLWSKKDVTNATSAAPRIHDQRCRMIARGLPAEPANGPSFCPTEWSPAYSPPWGPM